MKKLILIILPIALLAGLITLTVISVNAQTTKTAYNSKEKTSKKAVEMVKILPDTASTTTIAIATTSTATVKKTESTVKKTATSSKPAAVKTPAKTSSGSMAWSSSGLTAVRKIRNSAVRKAYMKKVEAYAKRNGLKLITATVVNSVRE